MPVNHSLLTLVSTRIESKIFWKYVATNRYLIWVNKRFQFSKSSHNPGDGS